MGLLVFLLLVAVVYLLVVVVGLKRQLDGLHRAQVRETERVDALSAQWAQLRARQSSTPTTPPITTPAVIQTPVTTEPSAAVPPTPPPFGAAPLPRAERSAPAPPADSWEVVVATNWLNKIGVFVFVVGIALLVSYSFTRVGPAGRITIGYLASSALLVAGSVLERRSGFHRYGYGLVAGGWAGLYFTTFAMYGVPAARILESVWVASVLLLAVAGGMVVHSLRYREPMVTAVAFVVAFGTLAISPLTVFALTASVPLVLAVLFVAQRFGWPQVSAVGVAATYTMYAYRLANDGQAVIDPYAATPYLLLGLYWIAFEVADLASRRTLPRAVDDVFASTFWLNTAGLTFGLLMTLPNDAPRLQATCLGVVAVAYLASAIVRRSAITPEETQQQHFTAAHASVATSAAFFVGSITSGLSSDRESLALLLEAQLLIVAGITLGDRHLRTIATVVAAVAALFVWGNGVPRDEPLLMAFFALVYYGNQEILHRRTTNSASREPAFAWMATILASSAVYLAFDPAYQTLAGVALGAALIEGGLRRGESLAWQGALTTLGWTYGVLLAFVLPPAATRLIGVDWGLGPAGMDEWVVLPLVVALLIWASWRLANAPGRVLIKQADVMSAVAGVLALGVFMLFEWRVVPARALTAAWAVSGLALAAGGIVLRSRQLRLSGLGLLAACLLKLFLVDARGLDAVARILSFVVLGAMLLGLSWAYTRYRDEIRRFL
jgi:uncharacterized membrane protein